MKAFFILAGIVAALWLWWSGKRSTKASGGDASSEGGIFGFANRVGQEVGGFLTWLSGGGKPADRSVISPSMLQTPSEGYNQYRIETGGTTIIQQDTTGDAAKALADYAARTGADVRVTTPGFTASVIHPKFSPSAQVFDFLSGHYKVP